MWKRKQILSTLLVAAMVGSMLTGCGQEKPVDKTGESSVVSSETAKQPASSTQESDAAKTDSTRISEDTITLTVAGYGSYDWNGNIQFEEYEKRLGIKLDATVYNWEQWESKFTLMLAADEMPDLVVNAWMNQQAVIKNGEEGYFLDFSQYLDIMPNLSKWMEDYPEYASTIICPDGGIYSFPVLNIRSESGLIKPIYMNKTWLENLGLKEPETLDEFYEAMLAIVEGDADLDGDTTDEIAFGWTPAWYMCELPILWGHGVYGSNAVYNLVTTDSNKVVLGDTTDNYKEFLKYMKKLYDSHIITEDAFVIGVEDRRAQWNDYHVGMIGTSGALPGTKENRLDWICAVGLTSDYNQERTLTLDNRVGSTYGLAANANTKYPEEIAKFVDYLFSMEGAISANSGYEGVSFDYEDYFGAEVGLYEKYAVQYGYAETEAEKFRSEKVVAPDAFSFLAFNENTAFMVYEKYPGDGLTKDPAFYEELLYEIGPGLLKEVAWRNAEKTVNVFPNVYYTDEEVKERSVLYTDVNNYLASAKAQFITGELDVDKDWDAHIATLKKMGLDRLLEIEQVAYDRFISK